MASEIRVNKIENRSGLGTVTFADTGVDLAGIVTATTFSGSGASLTNVPDSALSAVTASKLTGALPAISGANLTGIAATDNVRTGILDVAGISTFRNTMNVGAAVTISESGIEASGIGITCANINGTQIGGRRNLIINGAMLVAQRGTSNTAGGNGFYTVDRINYYNQGIDNDVTKAQADVASGTPAYVDGFRKSFKLTNGDQSSGAGASDQIQIEYRIEAQDIANSGWNYNSSTSFLTLSFYVKSSVAQAFNFFVKTEDGTEKNMPFSTPSLTADTWTKVAVQIKGDSGISFNSDSGNGLNINISPFLGTDYTDNSITNGEWIAWNSGTRYKDVTSTWYTTNDATFEITGLQLEVGSQATAFEHHNFGEELALCQRYFYKTYNYSDAPGTATFNGMQHGRNFDPNSARSAVPIYLNFPVRMRATPTLTWYAGDGQSGKYSTGSTVGGTNLTTEKTVGTSIDESETGIYHANFSEDVPATNLYAYHVLADAEL